MALQYSVALRNARLDSDETAIGTAPLLKLFTGAPPATCATAASGTALASFALPSDWLSAAASGAKAKLGTWSGTASGTGTAGYYRITDSAGTTCHEQGIVAMNAVIATNALTAANGNVLNFASTTGVAVGMTISGTGVAAGATVVALTSTTVTMSLTSTAGVANAASITFGGEMVIDNTSIVSAQTVTVTAYTKTASGA